MHIQGLTETRHGEQRQYIYELIIAKDPGHGPGWYIFGRDHASWVIRNIAAPSDKRRYHPHYNIKVVAGWPVRRQAEEALAEIVAHIQKEFGVTPILPKQLHA